MLKTAHYNPTPFLKRLILILSFFLRLRLPRGLFSSDFSIKFYAFAISLVCAPCSTQKYITRTCSSLFVTHCVIVLLLLSLHQSITYALYLKHLRTMVTFNTLLNIRENANLNNVSSADGKVHFALDMKAKHFPNVAYSASYYINALNRLQKTPP
jgi:hypothetical protein